MDKITNDKTSNKKSLNDKCLNVLVYDSTNSSNDSLMSYLLLPGYKSFKTKPFENHMGYVHPLISALSFIPISQNEIVPLLSKLRDSFEKDKRQNTVLYKTESLANCREFFEQLAQMPPYKHPYVVLFTNSSETKDDLLQIIVDVKYNKRIITIFNNDKNEEKKALKQLYCQLRKIYAYYNQLGDKIFGVDDSEEQKRKFNAQRINFLVCGRPGAGKSTFINEFFQEQKCLEGEQMSCTDKITEYYHEKYLLNVYDTPGFETNKQADDVITLISENCRLNVPNLKQIHMVFYMLNSQARTMLDIDKYFLKKLSIWKQEQIIELPTMLVLTKSKTIADGENNKNILHQDLNRLLYTDYLEIFPIDLGDPYSSTYFGMKDLLNQINEYFKKFRINKEVFVPKIEEAISDTQLTTLTKENIFLSKIGNMPLFLKTCFYNAQQILFSYLILEIGILSKTMKSDIWTIPCLKDIASVYHYPVTNEEIITFIDSIDPETDKKIMLQTLKEMNKYLIQNMQIDSTLLLGCRLAVDAYHFMTYVEKKINLDNTKKMVYKTIDEINEGIDGLRDLNEKFSSLEKKEETKDDDNYYYNSN